MKKRDTSVVAMLDLLGFSHIIEHSSLDEVERRYTQTLMSALSYAGLLSIGAFVFDDEGDLDMGPELWPVRFGVFSDTVVLYPRYPFIEPLYNICKTVALVIDTALQAQWLFRGGIDVGTFRALPDHNVYIGTGLIAAHHLEISQNWCGAIVGENAQLRHRREVEAMKANHLLVEYPVPLKAADPGVAARCLVVNWTYFDTKDRRDRKTQLQHAHETAPELAKPKTAATMAFYDAMVSKGWASQEMLGGRVFGDPTRGMAS